MLTQKNKWTITVFLSIFALLTFSAAVSAQDLQRWSYKIPVNVTYLSAEELDDALIYADINSQTLGITSCSDFRIFSTASNTFVPFQVSGCGTAQTRIIFKSKVSGAFSGTIAYLYLGNSLAQAQSTSVSVWQMLTGLTQDRAGGTAEVVDGRIYVLGGFSTGSGLVSGVESYDPSADSWKNAGTLKEPRAWVTSLKFGSEIGVIGGSKTTGSASQMNLIEIFNTVNSSSSVQQQYFPISAFPTNNLNMVSAGSQAYAISGGALAAGKYYRLDSGVWNLNSVSGTPSSTQNYSLAYYDGKAYLIGGNKAIKESSGLDITSGRISPIALMSEQRYVSTVIGVDNYIYVFGGSGAADETLVSVERYSIRGNKWETLESMSVSNAGAAVANIKDKIYVIGGLHYDRNTKTYSTLASAAEFSVPNWNMRVSTGVKQDCTEEICDGIDNDCDGYIDKTGTGESIAQQCGGTCNGIQYCYNGNWSACEFTATNITNETCDKLDNDCDGLIDEDFDKDNDTFFNRTFCSENYSITDCDDSNKFVNPNATEICTDSIDNNCNELIDINDTFCKNQQPIVNQDFECGNNVQEISEECDGSDSQQCPGGCTLDCNCKFILGDGICSSSGGETNEISPDDCKKVNYVPLIIVLIIGMICFIMVYYLKPEWITFVEEEVEEVMGKKHEQLPESEEQFVQKAEPTKEDLGLKSYIMNSLKQGYDSDDIKDALMAVGWPSTKINEVLSEFEDFEQKKQKPNDQIKIAPPATPEVAHHRTIDDFIKLSAAYGEKIPKIREQLIKAGWNPDLVEIHLSRFTSKK